MEKVTKTVKEFFGESYEEKEPMLYELLPAEIIQLNIPCADWREAIKTAAEPLLEKDLLKNAILMPLLNNVVENGAYIVISQDLHFLMKDLIQGARKWEESDPSDRTGHHRRCRWEKEEVTFFCCMSTVDHKKHMKAFFHLVNMLTNHQFKEELYQGRDTRADSKDHIKI
jgi:mannitol/fructose-specific phosphotransferase system IIA component (Ntr-type)